MNDEQTRLLLDDIKACQKRVRAAQDCWDLARQNAQACKKEWELCVAELNRVIEDGDSGQMRLPLNDESSADDDYQWRETHLMDTGLPVKHQRLLMKANIKTVGEWYDWHFAEDRKSIKGVTDSVQNVIYDTLITMVPVDDED